MLALNMNFNENGDDADIYVILDWQLLRLDVHRETLQHMQKLHGVLSEWIM